MINRLVCIKCTQQDLLMVMQGLCHVSETRERREGRVSLERKRMLNQLLLPFPLISINIISFLPLIVSLFFILLLTILYNI